MAKNAKKAAVLFIIAIAVLLLAIFVLTNTALNPPEETSDQNVSEQEILKQSLDVNWENLKDSGVKVTELKTDFFVSDCMSEIKEGELPPLELSVEGNSINLANYVETLCTGSSIRVSSQIERERLYIDEREDLLEDLNFDCFCAKKITVDVGPVPAGTYMAAVSGLDFEILEEKRVQVK